MHENMETMRIAILGALQDEIQVLVDRMTNVEQIDALQRVFYTGEIEGQKAVVVSSGVGKVRSSACTQFLIDQYQIDTVIVFGLAGALNTKLGIGDIVVSDEAIMYDYVVAGVGVNENIALSPIRADRKLIRLAMLAGKNVVPRVVLHVGTILTGDSAVADSQRRAELRREFMGDCVEMEGAAAGLVCSLNQIPFVIVRGISDLADEKAHEQFEAAFESALNGSARIVLEMMRILAQPDCDELIDAAENSHDRQDLAADWREQSKLARPRY
jgi:adenosylhomocysteine nucleosidase